MVEHFLGKKEVTGSIPVDGSINRPFNLNLVKWAIFVIIDSNNSTEGKSIMTNQSPNKDNLDPNTQKSNDQTYITLGLVFIIIGFATTNFAFVAVGIVFYAISANNNNDPFNVNNWFGNKKDAPEKPVADKTEPFTRENLDKIDENKKDDIEYLETDTGDVPSTSTEDKKSE